MNVELRAAIRKAISLEVWTLDYEPGTDDRVTTSDRAVDRILALPEMVELQHLARIGLFVVDSSERLSWIAACFVETERCKGWNDFRAAALAAGEPTP